MSESTTKKSFVESIAESKFMKKLEDISLKLSGSDLFSALSGSMGGTLGIIMVGSVFQIITIVGTSFLGWTSDSSIYNLFYTPYQYTMGILGFFMAFNVAYGYAKKKDINTVMAGFTAIICFFLVCCPLSTATLEDGSSITAINISNMGSSSMFVAIIIGLTCVLLMKFVKDKNWTIKLPDSVPEGIGASFQAMIPMGVCVIVWYGLSAIVAATTGTTLANIITYILSIPFSLLVSDVGIFVIIFFDLLFWFFGIHGTAVMFAALLVPYYTAYMTNAELAAAGQPLVYSPMFVWMAALSVCGGVGNTLPLVIMGLKSKSKTIKAVCKASLVPNICNINEPVIFGFPIMYNPTLMIPFFLNPIVVGILAMICMKTGIMGLPQVLVMTTLPVGVSQFVSTLDWRNVVFCLLMFPVVAAIWYPFYKAYEKQMCEQEALEEAEEAQ